jgi:hypothetical protein
LCGQPIFPAVFCQFAQPSVSSQTVPNAALTDSKPSCQKEQLPEHAFRLGINRPEIVTSCRTRSGIRALDPGFRRNDNLKTIIRRPITWAKSTRNGHQPSCRNNQRRKPRPGL